MAGTPPTSGLASLIGPSTRVTRRVDIYEENGTTPFMLDAPLLDGAVSVDGSRDERRTIDLSLENAEGALDNYPGGFWYDKVLKVYRGIGWEGRTESWVAFDSTNHLQTPDSSSQNVAGTTFRVRMKVSMADWTQTQWRALASKWDTAGNQRSWYFGLNNAADSKLVFHYSSNGTNDIPTASTVAPPFTNGEIEYVGVDVFFDVSSKLITFLTSEDGITWTPIGDSVVNATSALNFFDSNAPIRIGAQQDGNLWTGNLYYVGIFDDARTIVDLDLTNLENGAGGMIDSNGTAFSFANTKVIPAGLDLPGTDSHDASTPDHASLDVTGSLEIEVDVALDNWASGAYQSLVTKFAAGGQLSYLFTVSPTGQLRLDISTNGSATSNYQSSATGFSVGSRHRVKMTRTQSSGVVMFYEYINGTWQTVAGSGGTLSPGNAIFAGTAPVLVGGRADIVGQRAAGIFYRAIIRNGIDGTAVLDVDFTSEPNGWTAGESAGGTGTDATGKTLTINGAGSFIVGVIDPVIVSKVKGGLIEDQSWETQIGEFLVDRIDTQNFPHVTKVTGRDFTKKLMEAQFIYATTFAEGEPIETVIQTIAVNGGIDKYVLPYTGEELGRDFTFEAQTSRWEACKQIAQAYGYDLFFDQQGFLVMQEFQDPVSSPVIYTFETGEYGNLAAYGKSVSDTRIYNQIVVRGEATDIVPVTAVAENHEPSSPTSIENLDRTKTYNYTSAFITTQAQADAVAANFLAVHALEAFEVNLTSIVIPWLEASQIVEFLDPDPNPGDPDRFLLSSFSIPMKLGAMTAVAKRVTLVG